MDRAPCQSRGETARQPRPELIGEVNDFELRPRASTAKRHGLIVFGKVSWLRDAILAALGLLFS